MQLSAKLFNKNISILKFTMLYSMYSFLLFNIPLFIKFTQTLNPSSVSDFIMFFSLLIVSFLLTMMFYLIFFHAKITKFWAILFLIINALVFYFIVEYGILIDGDMIQNALKTDANEVRDLFSFKIFIYIFLFAIAPSIVIFFIKIQNKITTNLIFIPTALFLCLGILLANYSKLAPFFRVNREIGYLFVPFNYVEPLFTIVKNKLFSKPSEPDIAIEDLTSNLSQDINIVLIIGETARKKNFQLYGYEKETNPELTKIKDLKILNAVSCGTSTSVSVPCIFTFKKGYESYLKSIHKSGVFVKWYENNYGGCYDACDDIHTFESNHASCNGSCPDGVVFEKFYQDFDKLKNTRKPKLFVIHQNGSHGPLYFKRYPKNFSKFKPECTTANVNTCSKQSLINAYDNSILYTDHLLAQTIKKLKQSNKPSIMIFASDHGESLGENGIFLHGFPYAIAPAEQKEIPFIIWSSFPLKIKDKKEYIHKNILPTVLNILNSQTKFQDKSLNIIE